MTISYKEKELKQYISDTNAIRYKTNPSSQSHLKKAAKKFWEDIRQEIKQGIAILHIPPETIRELELQSYSLGAKEKKYISELLNLCHHNQQEFLSFELEHHIRKINAYVRANYGRDIKKDTGRVMNYGDISDARILYSAYDQDGILVTANIKDFLIYPLLYPYDEHERLYDLLSNSFIHIEKDIYDRIHSDTKLQSMLQELYLLDEID